MLSAGWAENISLERPCQKWYHHPPLFLSGQDGCQLSSDCHKVLQNSSAVTFPAAGSVQTVCEGAACLTHWLKAQWEGRWLSRSWIQLGHPSGHATDTSISSLYEPRAPSPGHPPQNTGEEQPLCPVVLLLSWTAWPAWCHQPGREVPALTWEDSPGPLGLSRALLLKPAVPSQNPLFSLLGPFSPLLTIKGNIKTFIRPLEPSSPAISVLWQIQDALVCLYGLKAKRSLDYQESGNMAIRVSLTLFIKAHILSMLDFSSKASRILPQNVAIKQKVVKTNYISCVFSFWAMVLHKVKFPLTL